MDSGKKLGIQQNIMPGNGKEAENQIQNAVDRLFGENYHQGTEHRKY
jgi:hypothetical protein